MAKDWRKMEMELKEALAEEERQEKMEEERKALSKEELIERFINGQLADNPRPLTSEFLAYVKQYTPGKTLADLVGPLLIGAILILATYPIWGDLLDDESFAVGAIIFGVGLVGLPMAFIIRSILKRRRTMPHYAKVLTEGEVKNAEVLSIEGGKHGSRRGKRYVTQTTVQLRLNNETFTLKTFDSDLHKCYADGPTLKVLWHPEFPDVIIPVQHLMDRARHYTLAH